MGSERLSEVRTLPGRNLDRRTIKSVKCPDCGKQLLIRNEYFANDCLTHEENRLRYETIQARKK